MFRYVRQHAAAIAAATIISVVCSSAGVAWASHQFSDVPSGSYFHDEIAWLVDNGIANGYPDGTFKGNNNITRNQAALWFANNNANITVHTNTFDDSGGSSYSGFVYCPEGKRAIAGGLDHDSTTVVVADSHILTLGTLSGWAVNLVSLTGNQNPPPVTITVTCVPKPVGEA